MKCLAIIPAYNEMKNIDRVISSIKNADIDMDIIVVNDCSTDKTKYIAQRSGAQVINLCQNLGIGGAVQTGYKYALLKGYDCAVQIDGDCQHDPNKVSDMIRCMKENNSDIVIGSRFIEDTSYNQSFFRKIGIKYFSNLIKILFNKKIYDITSGFRLVNKRTLSIFAQNYNLSYPEIPSIACALKSGLKIDEISTKMNKRNGGKSSITPVKSIIYMVQVTIEVFKEKINNKSEGSEEYVKCSYFVNNASVNSSNF